MSIDFLYALVTGWSILLLFWLIILIFIFIRKPPKAKLTLRMVINSLVFFIIGYVILFVFS